MSGIEIIGLAVKGSNPPLDKVVDVTLSFRGDDPQCSLKADLGLGLAAEAGRDFWGGGESLSSVFARLMLYPSFDGRRSATQSQSVSTCKGRKPVNISELKDPIFVYHLGSFSSEATICIPFICIPFIQCWTNVTDVYFS